MSRYRIISLFPPWFANGRLDLACREGLLDALLCTISSSVEKKMLILWIYSPLPQNFYLRDDLCYILPYKTCKNRAGLCQILARSFRSVLLFLHPLLLIACVSVAGNGKCGPGSSPCSMLPPGICSRGLAGLTACSSPQAWYQ